MRVAVLGAGQLAQMMGADATRLGVELVAAGPGAAASPAAATADVVDVAFEDVAGLAAALRGADVLTYELEHLPLATVAQLAELLPVQPPVEALRRTQDRWLEKQMLQSLGIETAPFRRVDTQPDLEAAAAELGYPFLVKTRTQGYDGKGQRWVRGESDLHAHPVQPGCIAEGRVPFDREVSVVAVRDHGGDHRFYPLAENEHQRNILAVSRAPAADVDARRQREAEELAERILEHLDYVGTLAVELFDVAGRWVANELAPRVHNSGHWTLEGSATSQFENHLRAICGLPLGATTSLGASVMVNLIGAAPPLEELLQLEGVRVHLYGKTPRPGRKLGHATVVAPTREAVERLAAPLIDLALRFYA